MSFIQGLHLNFLKTNTNEVPKEEIQLIIQSLVQQQFHHIIRFRRYFRELE